MDFEEAGLLEGLDPDEREARERLLERLQADGVTLDELKAAVAEDRLALLPIDRFLGGRYSAREVEQRTGLPAQVMIRIRRLLGLPEVGLDERVFGDEDIEAAQSTKLFIDAGLSQETIAEITRVLGEASARVANTTAAAFVRSFLKAGDSEEDVALRFAALAEQLTPAVSPVLVSAYNAHLREAVRRGVLSRAERQSGEAAFEQEMCVCFADLVGFTRLGGEIGLHDLGSTAGKLAALASDVTEHPVRLVKTIGDAAMYLSPEPGPLVAVALELVKRVEEAELPSLRAGIACGPVVVRAGDHFGHTVNVASRVTGIARPGSVLCTEDVRDAAPDRFDWSFAGRHRLKGLSEAVPLYRAHPLEDAATRQKANRRRRRASS